jgi:hypothetical protein
LNFPLHLSSGASFKLDMIRSLRLRFSTHPTPTDQESHVPVWKRLDAASATFRPLQSQLRQDHLSGLCNGLIRLLEALNPQNPGGYRAAKLQMSEASPLWSSDRPQIHYRNTLAHGVKPAAKIH